MSEYKVPLTSILEITAHPNADKLVIATVYGFSVVIRKDQYKVGDRIIYVPIDSIIPMKIEAKLFPEGSKIKLNKSRVRQTRIRQFASQGMIIDPKDVEDIINTETLPLETDLSTVLDITKYEPPAREINPSTNTPRSRNFRNPNPHFQKYNGLTNIKWQPNLFNDTQVVIQEKIHGSNARAGLLPYNANTLWKKFLKLVKIAPKFEKCYGSNNVDISSKLTYNGYYGEDIYGNTFKKMDVFSKLKPNEIVYGEIAGPEIQEGYDYGLKEHEFVLFDVKRLNEDGTQVWLDPDEVEIFAKERGFKMVPILYKGMFNMELAKSLTKGRSEFNDKSEKVREGIVIKAAKNYSLEGNKVALKFISEDYLADDKNTDFH